MGAMNVERALRDLAAAIAGVDGSRDRLQAARGVAVRACLEALRIEQTSQHSLPGAISLGLASPNRPARRDCAVFLLHVLAVPNLVPVPSYADLCALMEGALRTPLLRCSYPFGASVEDRIRVLAGLHSRIGELMEPMEPTFPSWPGLYAG